MRFSPVPRQRLAVTGRLDNVFRWPRNLPGTRPGDPMPPLLAVREFLAKHASTLKYFDAEVEAALIEAEQTGNFQELREAIAGGLWNAICAEHVAEIHGLNARERGELLRRHADEWLFTHRPPSFKGFLAAEHARKLELKPPPDEPMRGFLMPADDEQPRPKPYRWEFAAEAPPGFPQGSGEDDDPPDDALPAVP